MNRSDVQDNEKELDARQLEAGKESDAEQKPDASQAELQSPAKDSDADTLDFDKDSVTDMPKQQDSEKNAEADAEKTGNAEDSTGADSMIRTAEAFRRNRMLICRSLWKRTAKR